MTGQWETQSGHCKSEEMKMALGEGQATVWDRQWPTKIRMLKKRIVIIILSAP